MRPVEAPSSRAISRARRSLRGLIAAAPPAAASAGRPRTVQGVRPGSAGPGSSSTAPTGVPSAAVPSRVAVADSSDSGRAPARPPAARLRPPPPPPPPSAPLPTAMPPAILWTTPTSPAAGFHGFDGVDAQARTPVRSRLSGMAKVGASLPCTLPAPHRPSPLLPSSFLARHSLSSCYAKSSLPKCGRSRQQLLTWPT